MGGVGFGICDPARLARGVRPGTIASAEVVRLGRLVGRPLAAGVVDFANWPYYIDRRRDNSHPSLDLFTEQTGIRVNYSRPIRDNARFLDKIRPALQAGESTGYDLIVVTNGPELDELMEHGWLVPLDHSLLPNFERFASPLVRDPVWDRGNRFTLAWQSGFTGIAYRPEAVEALGREPSSIRDLWHPLLAGRVGMLVDLMDLGSFGLLAIDVDPETSTRFDWIRAAARLRDQRIDGIVRGYYDQGYLRALQRGDIWACQAWSGDIFQANQLGHPELRFVLPTEGAMFLDGQHGDPDASGASDRRLHAHELRVPPRRRGDDR
jgi:spermidine/putrescine transport system substrate-binding protein